MLQAVNNPADAANQHLRRTGNPQRKSVKTPTKAVPNLGELKIVSDPPPQRHVSQGSRGNPESENPAEAYPEEIGLQSELIPPTESEATEPSAVSKSEHGKQTSGHEHDDETKVTSNEARLAQPRQWNRSFADVRRTHAIATAAR